MTAGPSRSARLRALAAWRARAPRATRTRRQRTTAATDTGHGLAQPQIGDAMWVTPTDDQYDHLVSATTRAGDRDPARFSTYCGHTFLPAALTCAPKPHCPGCTRTAARPTAHQSHPDIATTNASANPPDHRP